MPQNLFKLTDNPVITLTRPGCTNEELDLAMGEHGLLTLCVNNSGPYDHDYRDAPIDLDTETALQLAGLLTFYAKHGRLPKTQNEFNESLSK